MSDIAALVPIVVLVTSFWVYYDARAICERHNIDTSEAMCRFLACLLLWVICFPQHLATRKDIPAVAVKERERLEQCRSKLLAAKQASLINQLKTCAACQYPNPGIRTTCFKCGADLSAPVVVPADASDDDQAPVVISSSRIKCVILVIVVAVIVAMIIYAQGVREINSSTSAGAYVIATADGSL